MRDAVERQTADATHAPADSTKAWLRALTLTAPIARAPHRTLPTVIDDLAGSFATAAALTPLVGMPTLAQTNSESSQSATAPGAVRRDHPSGPDQ